MMMYKAHDSEIAYKGQELLRNFFNEIGILTDSEIDEVVALTTYAHLPKGEYFITEGKICNDLIFTINGMLRSYFTKEDGEEVTYCFTFPQNLMTAYSSFIKGTPTSESIQALTDIDLLVIRKSDINKLAEENPRWVALFRFFAEEQYIALEQRIFSYQKEKAKQRYRDLIKKQPQLLQEVSLQHLASYLNITPRHLSRIRKEVD